MSFGAQLLVSEAILFFSMLLFLYWGMRVLLFLRGSEKEVKDALDHDLKWGRELWFTIQSFFSSSSQSLSF